MNSFFTVTRKSKVVLSFTEALRLEEFLRLLNFHVGSSESSNFFMFLKLPISYNRKQHIWLAIINLQKSELFPLHYCACWFKGMHSVRVLTIHAQRKALLFGVEFNSYKHCSRHLTFNEV